MALAKAPDGVDLRFAVQQIDGRQRARTKLPSLAANFEVIFPVHLSVEQCSSEVTADYKKEILARRLPPKRSLLIDLTGGFGIDFMALSPLFEKAVYVERNEELCQIAAHNFKTLGISNAEIINGEAETVVQDLTLPPSSSPNAASVTFFIDPARRSSSGSRTFAISDCTPDVTALMPRLKELGGLLFLKLSPMLDWHKAVDDMENCGVNVEEVHIVAVKNECKELLLLVNLSEDGRHDTRLFCKNDGVVVDPPLTPKAPLDPPLRGEGENFKVSAECGLQKVSSECGLQNVSSECGLQKVTIHSSPPVGGVRGGSWSRSGCFLLLPNAALMKAGCWDFIARRYGVRQADANSHLFFSDTVVADFPGKQYQILAVSSLNKKELREALQGVTQANIAVRNFPLTAEALRKRLKLKEGGDTYIFGTTIDGETKVVVAKSHPQQPHP